MATILKINDGENTLELMPPNEGYIQLFVGEENDQAWNSVILDKSDTENLIKYLQEYLAELE